MAQLLSFTLHFLCASKCIQLMNVIHTPWNINSQPLYLKTQHPGANLPHPLSWLG